VFQTKGNPQALRSLTIAMNSSETYAIRMRYRDKKNIITERLVSPIRFENEGSFLALCLCREEPRRFDLARCERIELIPAEEILMPVKIIVIDDL
jgi:predicted DNA-binding transcriptional regulator YafY